MDRTLVLLSTLALVLVPAFALVPAASATTCFIDFNSPQGIVAGARCVVSSEVCLFTNALRPGWCPV